jgi:integrase
MASVTSNALIVRPSAVPLVRIPPAVDDRQAAGVTVGELCEHFLDSKRRMFELGELCIRTVESYEVTCSRIVAALGPQTPVDTLTPTTFLRLRERLAKGLGPVSLGGHVQNCRMVFKYAHDCELIDHPIRFGPHFRRPAIRVVRLARHARGSQMLEAEEIRKLLDAAKPTLRAMIMLGVNCGFGNSDVGRLPFSALDLKNGWVKFPRPKTGIDRRCPLWPETIQAIQRAIALRPSPATSDVADLVFLTCLGRQWSDGEESSSLTQKFKKLMAAVRIERLGVGFYGLRRTFETIGGEAMDQISVDYLMGHVPASSDMAAVYRQRISDERLRFVTDQVRAWLFPTAQLNTFEAYRQKAADVTTAWENLERLTSVDVERAIKLLGISQTELARGIGLCLVWVNRVVRGHQPISEDTEKRLRWFMEQVAKGEPPKPLAKWKLRPHFRSPASIPITDEVRGALSHHPLTAADLKILLDCLRSFGVTQMQLAKWWGYKLAFLKEMRYCSRPIPLRGAHRLRLLFGVAHQNRDPFLAKRDLWKCRRQEIFDLLEQEEFGPAELRTVRAFLRDSFGINEARLAKSLGTNTKTLCDMAHGRKRFSFRIALRRFVYSLIAPRQIGGATNA